MNKHIRPHLFWQRICSFRYFLYQRALIRVLEIASVIFSNISLVLRVTQCCAISILLSSLFHVHGEFPSQIRNYLLRNSMRHIGLAQGVYVSRAHSSVSYSLAISLFGCVPCTFIAGPSTVHSWQYSFKLSLLEPRFPCKCMFLYMLVTVLKLCKYSFHDLTTPNSHTFSVHVCIFWSFWE